MVCNISAIKLAMVCNISAIKLAIVCNISAIKQQLLLFNEQVLKKCCNLAAASQPGVGGTRNSAIHNFCTCMCENYDLLVVAA
jgi:hypothetical protein